MIFIISLVSTLLVIVISIGIFVFNLPTILFKKKVSAEGAVLIDKEQRAYAHPKYGKKFKEFSSIGARTLYDVIEHGRQLGKDGPLFSWRNSSEEKFRSLTYEEVFQIIREIGSGITEIGLKPSTETLVGVYGTASVNYALGVFSCWPYSRVAVGIYDSLGRDGVQYIIRHAELKIIFADEINRVQNLIDWKNDDLALEYIISCVECTEEMHQNAKMKNLNLMTLQELRNLGRTNLGDFVLPSSDDLGLIMYTSGSTGEPKGCRITHENFVTAMFGCAEAIDFENLTKTGPVRAMNFLPLAHMFGLGTVLTVTYLGGEVGFWQGKVDKLPDDFRDFRPTLLSMVPRLLNRVYDAARSEALKKGLIGRIMFRLAVNTKLALIRRGDFSQNTFWDRIIFDKVRQKFGNQVRRVISSSAPLSPEVCQFARAAFSCFFIESYGQTECVIGCWQSLKDMESGAVGIPTPFNHVKLVDVPEKDYFSKNDVGEICIRSRGTFSGYLKDPEKTKEVIDDDGWLHTGDIGRWTENRTLKIIDRKKNLYKLSQGEYIAPEKIEEAYSRSQFVSQVFVYGDSYKSCLVAIVSINEDFLKRWAQKEQKTPEDLTKDKLIEIVMADMIREGKKRHLMSYEQIKAIEFVKEPFSVENGLLTPTLKNRRYAIEKKYKDLFEALYGTLKDKVSN